MEMTKPVERNKHSGIVLIAALVLLISVSGCAQKGTPEGGPPDTTAPTVISTNPSGGTVDVPSGAPLEIEFSEAVERDKLLANLYISPRREGRLETKWSGHTVRLLWSDSLRDNVTYRVTVGAKLTDRHNNPLTDPYTFAFSTGPQIDSGRIDGNVWDGVTAAGAVDVFAYPLSDTSEWDPGDVGFQTQTGADGRFDLPYLPTGRFRVIAVADKNGNNRPDPGEAIGVAAHDVEDVASRASSSLRLFTHVYDTSSFTLSGCSVAPDGSILIGFTHPIDTAGWQAPELQMRDSVSGETLPLRVMRPLPPNLTIVPAIAEDPRRDGVYAIRVDSAGGARTFDVNRKVLSAGTCFLHYPEIVDTVGPKVQWTLFPEAGKALGPAAPIEFGFSEPMDTMTLASALHVFDTTGAPIKGQVVIPDARRVAFTPASPWPEMQVIVTLDSAALLDRAGNPAVSQRFTWPVSPVNDAVMGYVTCRVEGPDPSTDTAPLVIWAVAARGSQRKQWAATRESVTTLALPMGNWLLGAFVDANGDGTFFPGSLVPYMPSERQTIMSDTVSVRARFTVEDIVIQF